MASKTPEQGPKPNGSPSTKARTVADIIREASTAADQIRSLRKKQAEAESSTRLDRLIRSIAS